MTSTHTLRRRQAAPGSGTAPGTGTSPRSAGLADALRSWRSAVSAAAVAGGAAIGAGCFLPWATAFAGLITFTGISAQNGRILAAAGLITVVAGLWHLLRGGDASRWIAAAAGFGAAGFAGYLLLRLGGELTSMGSGSMVVLQGGPGLWVAAGGGLLAFATVFLPPSAQRTLRAPGATGGLIAWAADRESAGLRRKLQLGLGVVWLLAAALQFQPYMFGRGFITQLIEPASMGSPAFLSRSVMSAGQFMLRDIVAWNALFAGIQLVLGLGLLWRRTTRAALAGTVVWGLAVWYLGESLGGLLSGSASPLTGAPGAALLYVLVAILLWPRLASPARSAVAAEPGPTSAAASGPLGARWSRAAWVIVWGALAALMLQPQLRAPGAMASSVRALATGEPGWLASMDRAVAGGLGASALVPAMIFACIFALIAVGGLVPRLTRPALILAMVTALVIWVAGENFGGMVTGTGTDPSTGPLLILLAAAFWPAAARSGSGRGRGADGEIAGAEPAGAAAEVEGESRPERKVAALAVQIPAGAARAPDRLR
jgi:hypothetical protein